MSYNGHKSHAAWNVSLWINGDEGLYNLAIECVKRTRTKDAAANRMRVELNDRGITETPDGSRYTKTNIRAAMVGM